MIDVRNWPPAPLPICSPRVWFLIPVAAPVKHVFCLGCQASGSIDISDTRSASGRSDDLAAVHVTKRKNKAKSLVKKTMTYIKEATASDFTTGYARQCKFCAGTNLSLGKDRRSLVCADCTKNA